MGDRKRFKKLAVSKEERGQILEEEKEQKLAEHALKQQEKVEAQRRAERSVYRKLGTPPTRDLVLMRFLKPWKNFYPGRRVYGVEKDTAPLLVAKGIARIVED